MPIEAGTAEQRNSNNHMMLPLGMDFADVGSVETQHAGFTGRAVDFSPLSLF